MSGALLLALFILAVAPGWLALGWLWASPRRDAWRLDQRARLDVLTGRVDAHGAGLEAAAQLLREHRERIRALQREAVSREAQRPWLD